MKDSNFGIGSTIGSGSQVHWLVIGSPKGGNHIMLVNLNTMMPCISSIQVSDMNHLTEDEARDLTDTTGFNWAFSDYTLRSEGFKRYD